MGYKHINSQQLSKQLHITISTHCQLNEHNFNIINIKFDNKNNNNSGIHSAQPQSWARVPRTSSHSTRLGYPRRDN